MVGVKLAEVGDGIFKIPPARIWHSAKRYVIRQEVEIYGCDLRGVCRGNRIWLRCLQVE
jgi:hypothetical protein